MCIQTVFHFGHGCRNLIDSLQKLAERSGTAIAYDCGNGIYLQAEVRILSGYVIHISTNFTDSLRDGGVFTAGIINALNHRIDLGGGDVETARMGRYHLIQGVVLSQCRPELVAVSGGDPA